MPITMNSNPSMSQPTQPVIAAGTKREWQKSEHYVVYFQEREGTTPGVMIQVQLPGIFGVENLPLQKEYNTGTDIAEAIKEQNAMTLAFQEEAKTLTKEGDYSIVQIDDNTFAKIFKPTSTEKQTLETSSKNFFHRELKFQRFNKNAA